MKSEIIKHRSGGGRLRFLLTFAIAFVLAMGSWSEARAEYIQWTVWDPNTGVLTLKSGDTKYATTPSVSSDYIWRCDEADDGWQRRKYGTDYSTVYMYQNGKGGIGEGIYKKVKKFVVDISYRNFVPTSINCFFRDLIAVEEIVGLQYMDITSLYNSPNDPYNQGGLSACFRNCPKLVCVRGLETWVASNITNFNDMFGLCESLEWVDMSGFSPTSAVNFSNMFWGCKNLKVIWAGENWGLNGNKPAANMFWGCESLNSGMKPYDSNDVDGNDRALGLTTNFYRCVLTMIPSNNTAYVTYRNNVLSFFYDKHFFRDLSCYYTLNTGTNEPVWKMWASQIKQVYFDESFKNYYPTTCYHWFKDCTQLTEVVNMRNLCTSKVLTMNSMFSNCQSLQEVIFNGDAYTSSSSNYVICSEDFENMFYNCKNLTSVKGMTINRSKVCSMKNMFYNCEKLKTAPGFYICKYTNNLAVGDVSGMFENCISLEYFTSVTSYGFTNMERMFKNCKNLKQVILKSASYQESSLTIKDLESTSEMFYGCTNLESVALFADSYSLLESPKLTNTSYMFYGCSSLKRIFIAVDYLKNKYVDGKEEFTDNIDFKNVTNSTDMFKGCNALKGGGGATVTSTNKTYAYAGMPSYKSSGYFTPYKSQLIVDYQNGSSPSKGTYYSCSSSARFSGSTSIKRKGYVFLGYTAKGALNVSTPSLEQFAAPEGGCLGEVDLIGHWAREIDDASIKISSNYYTGSVVPLVVVLDGKTLKEGTDYTVDPIIKEPKTYWVTITGKGDYAGSKRTYLYLYKADVYIIPDSKTIEYGDAKPELTYKVEGLKGSDKLTTLPQLTCNSDYTVGSYNISISNTPSAGNNYFVMTRTGTLTITPKPITVTPDALSKTYGDDDPEITYTVNEGGLIGSDVLSGSLSRVAGEAVGEYNIEQGSLANKNYAITIAEGAKFTINKKDINVTPLLLTKEYGQDDPELKYSYNPGDLVGSDKLTGALSRTAGEAVGNYDINIGTLENPNYNIILGASQFQIKARNLTDPVVVLESDVFVLDNGESKPGVTVYDGTKVVDPKEYTVEYTNNAAVGEGTVTVTANGNYVFNASKTFAIIDKADAYSVTYKTGDEITKTVYVAKNAATAEPSIIREGYSIEGFYQSAAFDESTKWDFNNKVNDHLTLYIKWIANQHKVSFELEGEPFDSPQTLAYGTTITYPEPEAREGYTFSGWNPAPSTMPDEDFTAVGSYIKNVHTITYTIDGAEYLTKEYEYEASIAIIDNPAAKVGYKFSGWTPSTLRATMPDEDIVVTGSYIPNKHKLVFNADGVAAKTIAEFAFGTDISTAIPQEAHKTYLFTEPPTGLLMPDYDLTVDGRFEINKYNIVYKLDGEIYTTIPTDAGSTIALIENPTRDGYTFSGWKSDYTEMPDEDISISGALVPNPHTITYKEDGKELTTVNTAFGVEINTTLPQKQGYKYVPSEEIPATVPDNNLVIDGKFVAIDYTLTYYLDYEEYKTVTLHFGDQIAAEAVPEQTGYKFSGWGDLPETMPDKDLTIFGTYEKLTYTITFMDGETKKSEQKLAFGDAIKQPSMTGKLGYTYVWKNCPEYMPDEDLVIVGGYEANLHKITYMVADTVFASVMVPYGSEITAIEGPAISGNETFAWGFIPETMPDNDITVLGSVSTPVANLPENSIAAKVWSYNHTIFIETAPDTKYTIVDLQGRVITTSTTKSTHDEIQINQSGIMIVIIGNQSFKLAL